MTTIQHSVGFHGTNDPGDVSTVRQLLNQVLEPFGGPRTPLLLDAPKTATADDPTVIAIKKFQWRQLVRPRNPLHAADGLVDRNGRTLERLNEFAEHRAAPNTASGIRGVDIPLWLSEMWQLIQRYHTLYVDVFPPELLIGLFWEETNFRNIQGIANPRVLGFGQVNRNLIDNLNTRFSRNLVAEQITGAGHFREGVELASLTLANSYEETGRIGRDPALHYYHRGRRGLMSPIAPRWLACMQRLQAIDARSYVMTTIPDGVAVGLREALWAARRSNPCSPDLAFP
jgi:hypothetical protein